MKIIFRKYLSKFDFGGESDYIVKKNLYELTVSYFHVSSLKHSVYII